MEEELRQQLLSVLDKVNIKALSVFEELSDLEEILRVLKEDLKSPEKRVNAIDKRAEIALQILLLCQVAYWQWERDVSEEPENSNEYFRLHGDLRRLKYLFQRLRPMLSQCDQRLVPRMFLPPFSEADISKEECNFIIKIILPRVSVQSPIVETVCDVSPPDNEKDELAAQFGRLKKIFRSKGFPTGKILKGDPLNE